MSELGPWTFKELRRAPETSALVEEQEAPDESGARRLGALRLSNRLKYTSLVIGVIGLLLSAVSITLAVVLSNNKDTVVTVVAGNGTTVVITQADAEVEFTQTYLCILGYWPLLATQQLAIALSPTNGSHEHSFGTGNVFWMPNDYPGAIHNGSSAACPGDASHFLSPSPPAATVTCMSNNVALTAPGYYYYIDGNTAGRTVGMSTVTFTSVPSSHPVNIVPYGTTTCTPTFVSASYTTAAGHYGTVVYNFANCAAGDVLQMRCALHGLMNQGFPRLTVSGACP